MLRDLLRRHMVAISVSTCLLPTALGIASALYVTPLYQASETIVTARNVLGSNIGEQDGPPRDGDLTAGVWEAIKRRDNLMELAQQIHLAEKVKVLEGTPLTENGKLELAVKTLEYRLNVKQPDGSTVVLSADWTDAQTAYDLAHGAALKFLETHKNYRTLKEAEVPSKPKYPVRVVLVFGGALLGLLLSSGISAALHLVRRR